MQQPSVSSTPLRAAIAATWVLLAGLALLNLGDGLQATLLGVRASLESFETTATGLLMSAFYVGFLGGSILTPRLVAKVGHIRVFGALASVASAAALIHAIFVSPVAWSGLRLVSGFCFAGLYIVAESWLNERATNQTRGQLLSIYMLVTYGGLAVGQLFLNLADPLGTELFILISVLISLALVPLLLSAREAPGFTAPAKLGLRDLYRLSPLGVVGTAAAGMSAAILFSMGPVFAEAMGLSVPQISFWMTAAVLGCVVLQWPIGSLSDRFDRRRVLTVVTFLGAMAPVAMVDAGPDRLWLMLLCIGLFGGLSLPMYALAVAHANDYLEPDEMVAASGGLVLVGGIGAVLGPASTAAIMTWLGPEGFLYSLATVHVAVGLFALYRMTRRPAKAAEDQGDYQPVRPQASVIALDWAHESEDGAEWATGTSEPETAQRDEHQ